MGLNIVESGNASVSSTEPFELKIEPGTFRFTPPNRPLTPEVRATGKMLLGLPSGEAITSFDGKRIDGPFDAWLLSDHRVVITWGEASDNPTIPLMVIDTARAS